MHGSGEMAAAINKAAPTDCVIKYIRHVNIYPRRPHINASATALKISTRKTAKRRFRKRERERERKRGGETKKFSQIKEPFAVLSLSECSVSAPFSPCVGYIFFFFFFLLLLLERFTSLIENPQLMMSKKNLNVADFLWWIWISHFQFRR